MTEHGGQEWELIEALKELMAWLEHGSAWQNGAKCETLTEAMDQADALIKRAESHPLPGVERPKSQGLCETTMTERFENKDCICPTYEGNLGPCAKFEEAGMFAVSIATMNCRVI